MPSARSHPSSWDDVRITRESNPWCSIWSHARPESRTMAVCCSWIVEDSAQCPRTAGVTYACVAWALSSQVLNWRRQSSTQSTDGRFSPVEWTSSFGWISNGGRRCIGDRRGGHPSVLFNTVLCFDQRTWDIVACPPFLLEVKHWVVNTLVLYFLAFRQLGCF